MTYPEIGANKRTDGSFRCQIQKEHHKENSPFFKLKINMISQFPLDYLHTVFFVVVKK